MMDGFADRLKALREKKGLTQKALANLAGLSLKAVSHWEQGLREPSWSNVQALADALGVDCRAFQVKPSRTAKAKRGQRGGKSDGRSS